MKILSIDVGIKNLAYCLLEITDKNATFIQWDVIDLCDDIKYTCMGKNKKNICCNKSAKFEKDNKYYCKIHAKKCEYKIPVNEQNITSVKKYNFNKLKCLAEKYEVTYSGKKKSDCLNGILLDLSNNYFNFISKKKTKDKNLVEYGCIMKNKFNKVLNKEVIDIVLVENQIGPLALRMKTLQGMIMQHFIEKDINAIYEISASNKLKEFLSIKKTSYNERKKASIEFTEKILLEQKNIDWLDMFKKHKKKDDLADCYLQARWYLKNNNLI